MPYEFFEEGRGVFGPKTIGFIFVGLVVLNAVLVFEIFKNRDIKEVVVEASGGEGVLGLQEETSTDEVYVDVSGAVAKPGVYKFSVGAKVEDALKQAGGFSTNVNPFWVAKNINFATTLVNGQKLYFPFDWEEEETIELLALVPKTQNTQPENNEKSSENMTNKPNINEMSKSELDELPGIGEVYAEKIISLRPFVDENDFIESSQIPKTTIAKFIDLVVFQ